MGAGRGSARSLRGDPRACKACKASAAPQLDPFHHLDTGQGH
jgi:hypothetical protein